MKIRLRKLANTSHTPRFVLESKLYNNATDLTYRVSESSSFRLGRQLYHHLINSFKNMLIMVIIRHHDFSFKITPPVNE